MDLIDADDFNTWPRALRATLVSGAQELAAYHRERRAIDRAAEENVMLRINRPDNPYEPAWQQVLDIANDAVRSRNLLGYHATRLTEPEISDVQSRGLEPLSVELVSRRLAAIHHEGLIDTATFEALRTRHQASDDNRANMTWFIFTRASLTSESGVGRFFRSWGGEALYNKHEADKALGPALQVPGTPSIVQAAVPCDGIETFMDVGQRLINAWCARQNIRTGDGEEFEGYVRKQIPGASVLRITKLGDELFDTLTSHRAWREAL